MVDGIYYDKEVLEEEFINKSKFMLEHNTPIWVGEFGPIYSGEPRTDAVRDRVLRDQLEIYNHHQANWAIWTYKDIGLQGTVYVAPDSPWMTLLRPILEKKARLGMDAWGGEETHIRHIMEPIEEVFSKEFPHYKPGPFGALWQARRLVRHILLSEALLPEFGKLFEGKTETEFDVLMQSFAFRNCIVREPLAKTLADYAR
jgi:hypothetical protein